MSVTAEYYWERIIEMRGTVRNPQTLAVILGFLRAAERDGDQVSPDPLSPPDDELPVQTKQVHRPSLSQFPPSTA